MVIVAPVETVKTKCIELNQPFVQGFKHILKNEGISGVYQGAIATALKQGSNQGLRFMWFNEYKAIVTKDGEVPLTPVMGLLGGMSAGCFSTLGNNPFDVVKVGPIVRWGLESSVISFLTILLPLFVGTTSNAVSLTKKLIIFRHECKVQKQHNIRIHWIASNKF